MTGIELIAVERNEQLTKHKRSVDGDADYKKNQLIKFATLLMIEKPTQKDKVKLYNLLNRNADLVNKYYDKDYMQRLVIAAALIAARIDAQQLIDAENKLYLDVCV